MVRLKVQFRLFASVSFEILWHSCFSFLLSVLFICHLLFEIKDEENIFFFFKFSFSSIEPFSLEFYFLIVI